MKIFLSVSYIRTIKYVYIFRIFSTKKHPQWDRTNSGGFRRM